MEIVDQFIILATVILLCSWCYLAWSLYKNKTSFVKFPPYGVPTCPFLYSYDAKNKKCLLNKAAFEAHTGGGTSDVMKEYSEDLTPYDRDRPCATHKILESDVGRTVQWDGLRYGEDVPNEYKQCCDTGTLLDDEKCANRFSNDPMEIDFGNVNNRGRSWWRSSYFGGSKSGRLGSGRR
tara:strand:- start:52 stop:588 length:537 start_codon:yes stop_codon:yes gene_type:complete